MPSDVVKAAIGGAGYGLTKDALKGLLAPLGDLADLALAFLIYQAGKRYPQYREYLMGAMGAIAAEVVSGGFSLPILQRASQPAVGANGRATGKAARNLVMAL